MRCNDQLRRRVGLLVDDELTARERDELLAHMADCSDCGSYRGELLGLRHQLRDLREAAPADLAHRLRASLDVEAAEVRGEVPVSATARPALADTLLTRLEQYLHPYLRPAMALLMVAVLSAGAGLWWAGRVQDRDALAHDVLAAHLRSLIQDNAVQVASLDTHTVKPWFAGRLDYTPVVKDLTSEGFKLLGGRLDYVDGRRVAALVYARRLHKINLFIWPAKNAAAATSYLRIDGYNIVSWTQGGMTFWAISDLDERELGQLPALL